MTDMSAAVRDVRFALTDPARLCQSLGLMKHAKRQACGVIVCCPVHGERNPSCSVTRGPDGTARVRCFACEFSADAIGLVAAVYQTPARGSGFRETLAIAAELGGLSDLAYELRGHEAKPYVRPPAPTPEPERGYPDAQEVAAVWAEAGSVAEDTVCSGALVKRRIDPDAAAGANLVRAIGIHQALPRWARRKGRPWTESGHRMVVRVFDAAGTLVSLRAWRVQGDDEAKRVPPAGHSAAGLVLANRAAVGMLMGRTRPRQVVVVEGEPDWLVRSLAAPAATAVIGIGSGWWTEGHAAKVPDGCEVVVRTHADERGQRYAEHVTETLGARCPVWRAR